jgi:hypothetical protein
MSSFNAGSGDGERLCIVGPVFIALSGQSDSQTGTNTRPLCIGLSDSEGSRAVLMPKVTWCANPACDRREGLEKPKRRKCAACLSVAYCSRDCQRADWAVHKLSCAVQDSDEEPRARPTAWTAALGAGSGPLDEWFAKRNTAERQTTLPPPSVRFPRDEGKQRVRVLIPDRDDDADDQCSDAEAHGGAGGEGTERLPAGWIEYRGAIGAMRFWEEGVQNGDIILLRPGHYDSGAWGLGRMPLLVDAMNSPGERVCVELIGTGRRACDVLIYTTDIDAPAIRMATEPA